MRLLFLLVVGIVVMACSQKTAVSSTEVTDSTVTRYVTRIDTVTIPGEKVTLKEYIECDKVTNKPKPFKAKAKNGKAHVSVKIEPTGELTAQGGCDSLKQVVSLMDKEIFRLRHEKKLEVRVVKEYKTHWFDPPARVISLLAILFVAGYIFIKLNIQIPWKRN